MNDHYLLLTVNTKRVEQLLIPFNDVDDDHNYLESQKIN